MIPVGNSFIPVGTLDPLFVDKYVCSHCHWWGVAQVDRASWSTLSCPRCGLETCSLIPDPVVTPIPINTLGDCPSGLQPEERSIDLFNKGIRGEVLYALADLETPSLQSVYESGNTITTSGANNISIDLEDGNFSINGPGSISFGSVIEHSAASLYSHGSINIQSRDDSRLTVSGATKDLVIEATGGGIQKLELKSEGISSTAIEIMASNTSGGINITSGGGGIRLDTTTNGDIEFHPARKLFLSPSNNLVFSDQYKSGSTFFSELILSSSSDEWSSFESKFGEVSLFNAINQVSGGKGITIIPDGGSMSGTYTGLVLCLGSATLTSNTTVDADLWVNTNLDGATYNLEVKGNMYIGDTATFSDAINPTLAYTLSVNGNLHGNDVDANILAVYGDVHLENLQTHTADVYGTLTVRNILNFSGRSSSYPDGGSVYADKMSILTAQGSGYSVDSSLNTLRSGSGGSLITTSDLTIGNIYISGGDRAGAVTVNASLDPANGGNLTIGGNAVITYLESNGGSVNCSGTAEPQPPGNGGILEFSGSLKISDLQAVGGSQLTGVSPAGNGGQLSVSGHFYGDQISLNGGDASIASPSTGGDGGTGQFYGATFINVFNANGGPSLGTSIGGLGGSLYSYGTLQATTVNLKGGSAQAGGDNGSSGLFEIYKGCSVDTLTMIDGSGAGSQATNVTQARLSGNCSFETINMTSRVTNPTNVRIMVWNNSGTLQVSSMPNKNTLNRSNSPYTATGSLAAYLQDSIFTATSASNSTWYRHTGTAI